MNTSEIKIEKGIPIPSITTKSKYPWGSLEIGDSFVSKKRNSNLTYVNRQYAPKRFVSKNMGEEGFRTWRIA